MEPHCFDTVQVDMESARTKELQFFKANPRYADLKNVGMNFLSGKLSNHLIGAIRRQLPAIQNQINTGMSNRLNGQCSSWHCKNWRDAHLLYCNDNHDSALFVNLPCSLYCDVQAKVMS
jgi:hypothetical protein